MDKRKCKRYILLGRRQTIKNKGGEDKIKLICEIYSLINGTAESGGIAEYEKIYYREIIGGRGVDLEKGKTKRKYLSIDRTLEDFVELNFSGHESLEKNEILKFRTYSNNKFLTRKRKTSFHEIVDMKRK